MKLKKESENSGSNSYFFGKLKGILQDSFANIGFQST